MTTPAAGAARVAEPQLRFLRAIADRVAVERVAEVYLFPPMRQGHVESGVGVVAVLPEPEADLASAISTETADDESSEDGEVAGPLSPLDDASPSTATGRDDDERDSLATRVGDAEAEAPATSVADVEHDAETEDVSPVSGDSIAPDAGGPPQRQDTPAEPERADPYAAAHTRTPRTGGRRSTIFSARYRLTLKGPDRGKWEVDVRAEADAPLITVDAVIRGIQRRAPDAADAERLTGDAFRELVAPPV